MDITQQEITVAKQVGYQVGRRWSAVEVEDLRQHLILWLFEHKEQVERFRDKPNGRSQLALSLKREALRFCSKETAIRQGRPMERNDFYTPEVVERALPFVFQAWPESHVKQDPNTGRPTEKAFDSGDAKAIIADLQRALKQLPPQNQMILELRFQEDLTLEDVAKRLGVSSPAIIQAVDKSVQLMSQYLSR